MRIGSVIFLAYLPFVYAAEPPQERKTTIDIEGLVIEGELQRPEAFFILRRDEYELMNTLTFDPLVSAKQEMENIVQDWLFK